MEMLIKSQDKKMTIMGRVISVGRRNPDQLIGEKVIKLMKEKNMTEEDVIKALGNSYRDTLKRVIANEELAQRKFIDKLIALFEVENDYFNDKELENVIITDNNIVIGNYETNDRAYEVKQQLDEIIIENYKNGKTIVIEMPEK